MSDRSIEDRISSIDEVRTGVPVMGMAAELPSDPPLPLPPEVEAVVVADSLRCADGSRADRITRAAADLKLFRAEMAK